jgi:hypothetical protein
MRCFVAFRLWQSVVALTRWLLLHARLQRDQIQFQSHIDQRTVGLPNTYSVVMTQNCMLIAKCDWQSVLLYFNLNKFTLLFM